MPYEGPTTRDGIRENLMTRYNKQSMNTEITLGDEVIGRMVSYGKKGSVTKSGLHQTEFSGRIDFDGIRLSVEGASAISVLNGLATQIGRELRARKNVAKKAAENGQGPDPSPGASSPKI